jgi:DNA-binding SARP family transcriptional activator
VLHVQLLGGFKITDDDKPVPSLTKPRMQSLLAYLLLHREAPQSRAHIAYTFWPDSSDSQARTNLRRELLQMRRALPQAEPYLRSEPQIIQWDPDAELALDVADFRATLAEAETSSDTQRRAELLGRAADMYQGDLLPGLYDEWILSKREDLAQRYLQALEVSLALHTEARNYAAAIQAAQRLLRYDPLYEAGYTRLMELYAYQGERARALHTYHTCASVLERELGVEPGPEIQRLYLATRQF